MGFFSNSDIDRDTEREPLPDCMEENSAEGSNMRQTTPLADTAVSAKASISSRSSLSTTPDDEKRRTHEQKEAKRKAEWEERQRLRKEKEQLDWEKAVSMDDDALIAASVKRLGDATERLTRRNMKLCVTEYVQTLCYEDMSFAKLAMHPRKSMVNCFHYINHKAREYLEKEMKDNDEKPIGGGFGGDVPDDLCYQWAEEYFRDLEAKEDHEQDEKYVPRPYPNTPKTKQKAKEPAAKTDNPTDNKQQLTLFGGAA